MMKKKNEINDELKKLSPFLDEMKKEDVFSVPKNYFESLPDSVLEHVRTTTDTTAGAGWMERLIENIALLFQPKYAVGFATTLLFVVSAVYFFQKPEINESDVLSQYIEDHIDEFDVEILWETSAFQSAENTAEEELDAINSDEYFDEIMDGLDDSDLEKLL